MARKRAETQIVAEPVKPAGASLYEMEQEFQALLDSDGNVSVEQQEEYNSLVRSTLAGNKLKRDRMGAFVKHCEAMSENAKTEIDRLTKRKQFYESAIRRGKNLIQETILSLPRDDRGNYRRLDGDLYTLRLQGIADRVEITDEQAIPPAYKNVTVRLSVEDWQALVNENPWLLADTVTSSLKYEISKTALREDLSANIEIPGADLLMNQVSVRID